MEKETQVIARGLRRRDPALLDRLIAQYHYRLLRYLLYLTSSRQTAEELFQETWLRVLERGRQYNGKSKFEAWLFGIARNLVIDLHRRRQPRFADLLEWRAQDDASPDFPVSEEPSALELVARLEESERIDKCLSQLPAVVREVIVLRFQEDMDLEEIASIVAAPVSTVKSRLYRGLEAMRKRLAGGSA